MHPTKEPNSERIRVGRVPFDVSTLPEAVDRVIRAGRGGEAISVRLSNAYCVALASKDPVYERLLSGPGLTYPDGTPVLWFMRMRAASRKKPSLVRGPSLFKRTIDMGRAHELRHFFLGTTPETLEKLVSATSQEFPGLRIAGTYSPPFAPLSEELYTECVEAINGSDAQIIWVALGTPKQDFLAQELAMRVNRPCVAVGAAFDFAAGTAHEAPNWLQNSGLEWLYRFASEPKRLWRRYVFGNARFLRSILTESGE